MWRVVKMGLSVLRSFLWSGPGISSAMFVENRKGGCELTSGCKETRSEYKTCEASECTVRESIYVQ